MKQYIVFLSTETHKNAKFDIVAKNQDLAIAQAGALFHVLWPSRGVEFVEIIVYAPKYAPDAK